MPPRKMARRDNSNPAYSWGVVGGFIPGRPVRGRGGGPGAKGKKNVPAKNTKTTQGKAEGMDKQVKAMSKSGDTAGKQEGGAKGKGDEKTAGKATGKAVGDGKTSAAAAGTQEKAGETAGKTR